MTTPTIIGLAGGIGSGKSTITKYFNEIGIQSVDADDVARLVVQPGSVCLSQIRQRYGDSILLDGGSLNRKSLRNIIFNNTEERSWLESVTHPAIRKEISVQLSRITSSYALLVHPLLFETKQDAICDLVIAIDVPKRIQLQRVMNRDSISQENAEKIMVTQLSNSERIKRADLVLENSGNIAEMNAKVFKLHKKILESQTC
ncbi:dephospho-CoA kinase [Marinomonas rhizomae]|uniref:Dephospho-CoA kinase n=1 Tax=Marinomonas rhizomae TaxID=491948 RepID=A0A366JDQ1_9GAMM|nr:dephospho-CoA kinase [Marinomonas rhizomae]RBP84540.1 dephospho-CoA kinase [Marinomonas rhizomae]RNF75253.1 dephospho-CoA kinase [Marinomonas rhizomae]